MDERGASGENLIIYKIRENPWIVSSLVLGIFAIILVAGSFAGISATGNAVSSIDAGKIVLDALQVQGVEGASIDSVKEVSGLYAVNILYNGKIIPIYITRDGKTLLQSISWKEIEEALK